MAHGWVHLLVIGRPITGWTSVRSTQIFPASFHEPPSKKNKQTNKLLQKLSSTCKSLSQMLPYLCYILITDNVGQTYFCSLLLSTQVNNTMQDFDPDHGPIFNHIRNLNSTLVNEVH